MANLSVKVRFLDSKKSAKSSTIGQTPNRFELSGHAEALPAIRWPALRILLMVARQTDYNRSSGGRFSGVFHQRLTDCLPGESADCMITDRSITANSSG